MSTKNLSNVKRNLSAVGTLIEFSHELLEFDFFHADDIIQILDRKAVEDLVQNTAQ